MTAIGMGLVYLSYTGVLWGVALIQGKNLGIKTLFSSAWPPDVPSASTTSTNSSTTKPNPKPPKGGAGAQGTNSNILPTPTGYQTNTSANYFGG